MLSASSPIAYPPSSSPPVTKRPLPAEPKSRKPKAIGGFLVDDDSDGEDDFSLAEPAPKRRMLGAQQATSLEKRHNMGESIPAGVQNGPLASLVADNEFTEDSLTKDVRVVSSLFAPTPTLPEIRSSAPLPSFLQSRLPKSAEVLTCSGKSTSIQQKKEAAAVPFEKLVAARSTTKVGRAKKSYYGIDIHQLIDDASKETYKDKNRVSSADTMRSFEQSTHNTKGRRTLMWTEKYRARNFMELVGDDRTHRQVLRWLKAWDPLVFPKSGKTKSALSKHAGAPPEEEKPHRKILMLTGPPGLGKTTLAHVCARQAGYEVMEINASDERSSDVVKNRIRTSVGTESVKTGSTVTSKNGHVQKIAHPLCVVVDEVDGVVSGSGGSGEGGFIRALIDLIILDEKNSNKVAPSTTQVRKKKGDDFKLLRPLILICNDVYHPSLRPLRQSNFAEIIHIRKPPLDAVVGRMKSIFEKEGVSCDSDAVRRLCEATWGVDPLESRKGREGAGEGDLRGVMVVGEWAAGKLRASKKDGTARLTRKWVEQNMVGDLSHGGGSTRGAGRGGVKELVKRVFLEGAGYPKTTISISAHEILGEQPKTQLGVAELLKKAAMERLREMVDTSDDIERVVTDIFSEYPNQPFNDDSILSKPDMAYEWFHFHDSCSSRVFTGQEFELAPYLSQPVLACHSLFSSPARHYFGSANEPKKWGEEEVVEEPLPFTGPRADYSAHEAEKANRATILALQSNLSPILLRSFRSPEDIATDLLPYLTRILTPEIKPIIVGGSGEQKGIASVRKETEKAMVKRAVDVMSGVGIVFERGKLDGDFGSRATQWVYRMEPPLDILVTFETASASPSAPPPVRYAVRQVLDQEYQKNIIVRENAARQARFNAGNSHLDAESLLPSQKETETKQFLNEQTVDTKRDFFGRVLSDGMPLKEIDGNADGKRREEKSQKNEKVWVSYHEGFSNAVRKPITIQEFLRGL
ncbi:hypothetical protein OIDMADRAFT_107508 [Oidiodendron maius Zn]|uniref:AAA+ ATPase domain-containing protein n=1 Tax=Oidiodendron maius (strain Zn) TaxID=913774 RepID=A0A0C3DAU2_OIDMZ|nr:hypothetical protein OIDMADRAFT_107508 [Oidiodendron maius Zn]